MQRVQYMLYVSYLKKTSDTCGHVVNYGPVRVTKSSITAINTLHDTKLIYFCKKCSLTPNIEDAIFIDVEVVELLLSISLGFVQGKVEIVEEEVGYFVEFQFGVSIQIKFVEHVEHWAFVERGRWSLKKSGKITMKLSSLAWSQATEKYDYHTPTPFFLFLENFFLLNNFLPVGIVLIFCQSNQLTPFAGFT